MVSWLSYAHNVEQQLQQNNNQKAQLGESQGSLLGLREFSFTIKNDIYIRYLSFKNKYEMMKEIKRKMPHKIDIGAIYNIPPKEHHTVRSCNFVPKQRELVFDIDLTDYAEVQSQRKDEKPSSMWVRGAWRYMAVAIKLVTQVLKDDFGFQHLLWVFSGRRGVHCWVCDSKARLLTDQQRTAVIKYLSLIIGSKVETRFPLHPSLQRFMPMLTDAFEAVSLSKESPEAGQDVLATKEGYQLMLKHIPDADIAARLEQAWSAETIDGNSYTTSSLSMKRWKQLKAAVLDAARKCRQQIKSRGVGESKSSLFKRAEQLEQCIERIILFYVFPRLDVNVSTHRNHLLKSPFVIHPKTGKVCVPIFDIETCERFDPDGVPTLSGLVKELNEFQAGESAAAPGQKAMEIEPPMKNEDSEQASKKAKLGEPLPDYQKVSLFPYITKFEDLFLKHLLAGIQKERLAQKASLKTEPAAAVQGVDVSW